MRHHLLENTEHMFKLDPAEIITDDALASVCQSGTDAVVIGGTDRVTFDNVLDLMTRVRSYAVPCYLEVANMDAVIPDFDHYLIPMVLNSQKKRWLMDEHHQAVKTFKDFLNWDDISVEGYCILNSQSKAFQYTDCYMPDTDDVLAYAAMAEHMFHLPVFYLEYSGVYGDIELAKRVKEELTHTRLVYGGGIAGASQAREMKNYADTIVVGNLIYTDVSEALATVKAIKE